MTVMHSMIPHFSMVPTLFFILSWAVLAMGLDFTIPITWRVSRLSFLA